MARNFGHPRAVEKARLRTSESHNPLRLRDFANETDLKTHVPSYSSAKSQMLTDSLLVWAETQNNLGKLSASML